MEIDSLDIRLLTVFAAIMRDCSVTKAAAQLGLTQPAISQALAKLRRCLDDPLFVRGGKVLVPTPRALQLVEPIGQILATARTQLARASRFAPRDSDRVFTFYASDAGSVVFVAPILKTMQRTAPRSRLRVMPLFAPGFPDGLASGEVDLALGSFPILAAGYYQKRLYVDEYVCLQRRGAHRRSTLSRDEFLAADHLLVEARGTGHAHQAIEQRLQQLLPPQRIVARVPSFLAAPAIVAQTDLVLTVPARVGAVFAKTLGLRSFAPPIELPRFEVRQYWHERFHHDSANRWLRERVAATLVPPK